MTTDSPRHVDIERFKGTLYGSTTGYGNAPGQDTGDKVYSIGTYGSWQNAWTGATTNPNTLCTHISNWQNWFVNNSHTDVRSFLYLADETMTGVEGWATWMSTVTGCQNGSYKTWPWVTSSWPTVYTGAPHVGMPATTNWMGVASTTWATEANYYLTLTSTQGWAYNGYSPWTAMVFNHEEEGWGPREIAWGAFKEGAPRMGVAIPWFLWEVTYFNDTNDSHVENDLWNQAVTFGYRTGGYNTVKGQTGYQYNNGDGVMMYPGTDLSFPANNYNEDGPFASWRLKMFRRGVQDADYMAQAYAINPVATMAIVNGIAQKVLWEKQCYTLGDCSYTYGERGFTQEAGAYETAREQLAQIIDGTTPTYGRATKSYRGKVSLRGRGILK